MPRILFVDNDHPVLMEQLTAAGFRCDDHRHSPREQLLEILPQYDGVVVRSRVNIDREWLERGTRLKCVARWGVGTEHIDLQAAAELGITVFNSPEGSKETVGEHTMGLLLMVLNHLGRADRQVRNGQWIRGANRGTELGGKTVGILGYGNMGQALARRLQGWNARVVAYDKYRTGYGDQFAAAVSLEELQQTADILSIHIPLEGNHYFVNGAFLDAFAKPVFVVNTARGGVLHTADLVERLQSGKVPGAALDVIEYEEQSFLHLDPATQPAPFQYLLQADNVVLTPHIAGWSHEAEEGHGRTLARKMLEQVDWK